MDGPNDQRETDDVVLLNLMSLRKIEKTQFKEVVSSSVISRHVSSLRVDSRIIPYHYRAQSIVMKMGFDDDKAQIPDDLYMGLRIPLQMYKYSLVMMRSACSCSYSRPLAMLVTGLVNLLVDGGIFITVVGLVLRVPDQFGIAEETDRSSKESHAYLKRRQIGTVFSMYGYNYMKENTMALCNSFDEALDYRIKAKRHVVSLGLWRALWVEDYVKAIPVAEENEWGFF
ncbi:hypothetical protein Tco_0769852 [Tanacetum coccineum]|uniref:Uncharacterized protein n=1 Tax=Tanacetum coccineum TaxID=301880 RepID=A0ABQ4ZBT2_9ASTR